MFYRIIFLLLIVSSLSCNFNRLSVVFVFIVHERRLQEYLEMLRVSNALERFSLDCRKGLVLVLVLVLLRPLVG